MKRQLPRCTPANGLPVSAGGVSREPHGALKKLTRVLMGRRFCDQLFAHELSPGRLWRLAKGACAAVFGKSVACHLCGQRAAKVLPVIWRGRVELWGMHRTIVRVEFEDRNALRFTHVLPENCPSLREHDRS
ncbi:MAG: hypothetical protein IAE94_08835 [Chthoniobacterales bacterium]|nr:hypothetical protein [Chthoniobacterales bacterium]